MASKRIGEGSSGKTKTGRPGGEPGGQRPKSFGAPGREDRSGLRLGIDERKRQRGRHPLGDCDRTAPPGSDANGQTRLLGERPPRAETHSADGNRSRLQSRLWTKAAPGERRFAPHRAEPRSRTALRPGPPHRAVRGRPRRWEPQVGAPTGLLSPAASCPVASTPERSSAPAPESWQPPERAAQPPRCGGRRAPAAADLPLVCRPPVLTRLRRKSAQRGQPPARSIAQVWSKPRNSGLIEPAPSKTRATYGHRGSPSSNTRRTPGRQRPSRTGGPLTALPSASFARGRVPTGGSRSGPVARALVCEAIEHPWASKLVLRPLESVPWNRPALRGSCRLPRQAFPAVGTDGASTSRPAPDGRAGALRSGTVDDPLRSAPGHGNR